MSDRRSGRLRGDWRRITMATVALVVLANTLVHAQESGRIMGRVIDARTGRGISSARVSVVGTERATLSGVDGRYLLLDLAPGEVAIRVEQLGYATKVVSGIRLAAGESVTQDVSLETEVIQLEAIEVSASVERGSAAAAVNRQRTATAMTSAVSAEQIARSPDGNAAAAIRRVSGVTVQDGRYVFVRGLGERYTTTSLNGARVPSPEPERKIVPLDLFPASLLETITTSKTFTPDQPGDFSGAQVEIRTRDFPVQPHLTLSASLGYAHGATGSTSPVAPRERGDRLAVGAAKRRIPAEAANVGDAIGRGPEVNRVVSSFRNVWSVRDESLEPDLSLGLSWGRNADVLGIPIGVLVSGTYSSGHDLKTDQRRARAGTAGSERDRYDGETGTFGVLVGGIANVSAMLGRHTLLAFHNSYNRGADNEARRELGTDENTRSRVQIDRLRYVERTVRSHQLVGRHDLPRMQRFEWALTATAVERDEPDRSEFVTWLDPEVPVWFNDFEGAVRTFGTLEESARQFRADYQVEWGETAQPWRLKLGALYRTAEREASSQGFRIQAYSWAPDDPRWQLRPEEFFDGRFATDDDAVFLLSRELAGGRYTAEDRLAASYGMLEIPLGRRVRLITGARLEHAATTILAENNLGQPTIAEPEYTDLLPAALLNIDLTERQKVRLSATRTLARPEYRELAPVTYREVLGGEQVIGNAELRRTRIDNYDVRWEFYPGPGETVSLALFGKRFTDPIEERFLARSGTDTRTFENAERAVNYGLEAEVVTGLRRIGDALADFSAFANATWMGSEVTTRNEQDEPRPMVGQAPYVINAGVTYSRGGDGVSATILFNQVGPRIVNARASGTQVDNVVEEPSPRLDLSFRFPAVLGTSVKLDLKNLLDSPHEVRQGDVVREYHRTGRSASLGLSRRW